MTVAKLRKSDREDPHNGRHKKFSYREHGEDGRRKDRGGAGESDVQLRTTNLQHHQDRNAVRHTSSGRQNRQGRTCDSRERAQAKIEGCIAKALREIKDRIAIDVREAIAEAMVQYDKERLEAQRRKRPFERRLREFLSDRTVGDWYCIEREAAKNKTVRLYDPKVETPPTSLQFARAECWFKDNEPRPMVMRGSIAGIYLRRRNTGLRQSYYAEAVFKRQVERWVRKREITALTKEQLVAIASDGFWEKKAARLLDRYGTGTYNSRDMLRTHLYDLVSIRNADNDRSGYVLLKGKQVNVDEEKHDALMYIEHTRKKIR